VQTYERPESGCLYGDKAAAAQFDRLASLGWQAFLGTRDGKAQYAPAAENDTDRWLAVVYGQLEYDLTAGPNYLRQQDCLVFHLGDGMERIEEAENYALPMTYGPIRDPDDLPAPDGPFDRWRITELTTDVFAASAAALDVLLSDPNPAGNRVISWQEWDAHQRSPALQEANWLIDMIRLAHGRTFPICRRDGMPSSRALPSICPKAEPKPPVELRPDGEMMAMIEERYRSMHLIGDDQSLHWVGWQRTPETTCTCDLMARIDAPRSAEWRSLRQLRQAVVALFTLLHKCAVGRYRMQQFRKAGAVVSEQGAPDVQPFDRLEQRIAATATAAGVALPDGAPIVPNWVRSPDDLPQSEEWERWESDWRAVRVAVETRLAALDGNPLPCQDPTVLRVDTRQVPMEAPANTPAPLREAFDSVARALFQAAEMRLCPPTARLGFEQQARALSDAYRIARERYAAAELHLRAVADDDGCCAFQDALSAVCRVNDAAGHVMLNIVPFHRATAHIQAVPPFDLARLLRVMLRQTGRAALQLRSVVMETDAARSTSASGGRPEQLPAGKGVPMSNIVDQLRAAVSDLLTAAAAAGQIEPPPANPRTMASDAAKRIRRAAVAGALVYPGRDGDAWLLDLRGLTERLCRLIDTAEAQREQCTIPLGNKAGLIVTPERDCLHDAAAELAERHAELDALRGFSTGQPSGTSTQQKDSPPMTFSASTPGAGRPVPRGRLKEPSREAFAVYWYGRLTGKTQTELADDPRLMKELGRKVGQGTISRWLKRVARWIEAGNAPSPLSESHEAKPTTMDPEKIDLGPNREHRPERQRNRRSE
jgi:hypothetical protein